MMNSGTTATTLADWPPKSLLHSSSLIVRCELLELDGSSNSLLDPTVAAVVHMAALLHQQDWMGAQHLYQRSPPSTIQPVLDPWYRIAATALTGDCWAGVWSALQQLPAAVAAAAAPSPLPAPLVTSYATELAQSLRVACLKSWITTTSSSAVAVTDIPSYYAPALGFGSHDELLAFALQLQQQQQQLASAHAASNASSLTNITQAVAFLESRFAVTAPLLSSNNNSSNNKPAPPAAAAAASATG